MKPHSWLSAAVLLLLVPTFASEFSRGFHPRGLLGLELRGTTGQLRSAFFDSDSDDHNTLGKPVNVSMNDSDGEEPDGRYRRTPPIQLVSSMPQIERRLSLDGLFPNKRPFSIEDLGSLLTDPMGLFQKRKGGIRRAASEVIHLADHSKNVSGVSTEVEHRPLLTIAERETLVRKWGVAFELAEAEAVSIFERLRTSSTGLLSKDEFMAALRLLGVEKTKSKSPTFFRGKNSYNRLLEFMFKAIDLDNVGAVSCYAFLDWLLTMTSGNPEARLRWGFNVCDTDGDGYANKVEITALLTSMFSVLTGLRLDHNNPYVDIFVASLFQRAGAAEANAHPDQLSWEDYRRGCLGSADVMALVHSPDQPYRKGYFGGTESKGSKRVLRSGGLALRLGKAVFMSQRKCDFILSMMLGLQVAVEPPNRATTPPLEVENGEDDDQNIFDAIKGFFAGLFSGDREEEEAEAMEEEEAEAGGGWEEAPSDGDESKPQTPLLEKKWWKPWKASRRLRPEITVQTYQLPSVLRWSELQSWGWTCVPSASACVPGGSPEELPSAITSYGASLYRQVRNAFGISDDTFLASLGIKQVIGGLLMGDMRGMAEQVSEGRSGSLFYYSHDGKFMVKTVSSAESKAMLNMLPDYCSYILKNPNTLLMRILGQFDLLHCGKKHHLVVLANVFNTSLPIHERFDLKGSTFGRTLGPKRGIPGLVHRDLDFSETGRQIMLSRELAERLQAQIRSDARFLELQNVLDYSLLVGVHRRKKASDASREGPLYPREASDDQYGAIEGNEAQFGAQAQTWVAQNSKSLQVLFDTLRGGLEANLKKGTVSSDFMDQLVFSKFAEFAHKCSSKSGSSSQGEGQGQRREERGGAGARGGGARGTGISAFQQVSGGMYGSSRAEAEEREEEVIFVGIIDTLVPFKAKKKAEFWIKSIVQRGKNFSVIPPKDYARRFVNFCTSLVHSFPS